MTKLIYGFTEAQWKAIYLFCDQVTSVDEDY